MMDLGIILEIIGAISATSWLFRLVDRIEGRS